MLTTLVCLLVGLPPVVGLDHVPIAVNDLDGAVRAFEKLGFAIKPGLPHANGLRNAHVKFPDGTELELITAPAAVDAMTTAYKRHLEQGDGPAYLALYTPDRERLTDRLSSQGFDFLPQGGIVTLSEPRYVFFGRRNASPTDRREHFAHSNGAYTLDTVRLQSADLGREKRLFASLGAHVAGGTAHFLEGRIELVERGAERKDGRRIVGVTLLVRDTEAVAKLLYEKAVPTERGRSVTVRTHGFEIEFLEPATRRT